MAFTLAIDTDAGSADTESVLSGTWNRCRGGYELSCTFPIYWLLKGDLYTDRVVPSDPRVQLAEDPTITSASLRTPVENA